MIYAYALVSPSTTRYYSSIRAVARDKTLLDISERTIHSRKKEQGFPCFLKPNHILFRYRVYSITDILNGSHIREE